jgi:hypothetical protein
MDDFANCILSGRKSKVSGEEGLRDNENNHRDLPIDPRRKDREIISAAIYPAARAKW